MFTTNRLIAESDTPHYMSTCVCTHAYHLLIKRLDESSVLLTLALQLHDVLVLLVYSFAKLRYLYLALRLCTCIM